MAHSRGTIDVRFALLGITGRGKSSLGNALLGKNVFKTSGEGKSETSQCSADHINQHGRQIKVVDTPGFFDTEMTFSEFQQRLIPFLDKSSPGPHVILFLIKADRFTSENRQAVRQYCEIFGEKILRHTIVVFTHLNADTTEEEYMSNVQMDLQFFLNKCENRYVFMPIPSKPEAKVKLQALMNMADQLVAANNGDCYTDEMYRAQEKLIKEKLEEQARQKREEEEERLQAIKDQISAEYDLQVQALRNDVNMCNAERERKQGELDRLMQQMEKTQQNMDELQKTITMQNQRIADLSSGGGGGGCTIL